MINLNLNVIPYLSGKIGYMPAEMTLDRDGKVIPAAPEKKRLLLDFFKSNAFALELVNKNDDKATVLPIYVLSQKKIYNVVINREELTIRLHLKKDISKFKAEELVCYLNKKKDFFSKLPTIIEDSNKIQKLVEDNIDSWPIRERYIFKTSGPIINIVKEYYKKCINNNTKMVIPLEKEFKIFCYRDERNELELCLVEDLSKADVQIQKKKILGRGAFGQVEKQWCVNRACAIAFKRSLGEHSAPTLVNECDILTYLHSQPEAKTLAVQPLPHFFFSPEDEQEEKLACYIAQLYDMDLYSFFVNFHFSTNKLFTLKSCYNLAKTVAYAHKLGIVHCDIRPENILVKYSTGQLDLCDWGAAYYVEDGFNRCLEPEKFLTNFILPSDGDRLKELRERNELKEFQMLLEKIDVYQLGIVFYQILTDGKIMPFSKGRLKELNFEPLKNNWLQNMILLVQNMVHPDISQRFSALKVKEILYIILEIFKNQNSS